MNQLLEIGLKGVAAGACIGLFGKVIWKQLEGLYKLFRQQSVNSSGERKPNNLRNDTLNSGA